MNDRVYYSRDAEMRANRERMVFVFTFLSLGLGIGAALALLFAPKSGDQMRREIARSMEESLGRGSSSGNALKQLSKDFADLRKTIEDRIEHLR
jgi:gas vesicle protein